MKNATVEAFIEIEIINLAYHCCQKHNERVAPDDSMKSKWITLYSPARKHLLVSMTPTWSTGICSDDLTETELAKPLQT